MSPAAPRIALIGVSGYAKIYLQLLAENQDRVHLVAAVIINPQEEPDVVSAFQARGVALYADYQTMLARHAGQLDLCLIPTGIAWHARMTIAALRAGAHVLVEKPLAGSVADVDAIARAERETDRFVAVGFQDVYAPEVAWLKDQLRQGLLGKLSDVRMLGLWPRPATYFTRNHWAGRLFADGASVLDSPLNNAFGHFINLALFLTGPQARSAAQVTIDEAELYRAHPIESFDTAVVRAHSPEGIRYWFGASHSIGTIREPELYLQGSHGQLEWWHEKHCLITLADGRRIEKKLPDTTGTRRAMFAAVLARLKDRTTPVCDTTLARPHTAFIEAVHAAARVQTIPPELIDYRDLIFPHWSGRIPVVRGLQDAFDQALTQRSTLAAAGFTTATPLPLSP